MKKKTSFKWLLEMVPDYDMSKGLFIKVNPRCRTCHGKGYVVDAWCDSKSAFDQCSTPCVVRPVLCPKCACKHSKSWRKLKVKTKPGLYNQLSSEEVEDYKSKHVVDRNRSITSSETKGIYDRIIARYGALL